MALQFFILLCSTQWQKRLATTIPDIFPVPKGKNVICQIKVCYAAINTNPGKWSGLPPKKSRDHTCPGKHNEETTVSPRLEEGSEILDVLKTPPLLFIYNNSWPCWAFVAARRLFSSCGERGLLSSCRVRASCCGGFSCLWSVGSRHPGFVAAGL